jgi:nucleoside-diphosphate-sugar epimerase
MPPLPGHRAGSSYATDWTGQRNLFAACGRAGVKRLVFRVAARCRPAPPTCR